MKPSMRFRNILLMGVVLAVLLLGGGPLANPPRAAAQEPQEATTALPVIEPGTRPYIPQHRTGHLAKTNNLDELVADGRSDPLAGNYRIVDWERVVLAYDDPDGHLNRKMFAIDENLGNPAPKALQTDARQVKGYDVATGYLSNDPGGVADIVIATVDTDYKVKLLTSVAASDLNSYTNSGGDYWLKDEYAKGAVAVATGNFGQGYDKSVVVFQRNSSDPAYDGGLIIEVVDLRGSAIPDYINETEIQFAQSQAVVNLDVATGDFNGDGLSEIAVVWLDPTTNQGHLHVLTYSSTFHENSNTQFTAYSSNPSIATGDFEGDSRDEIVVGWQERKYINAGDSGTIGIFEVSGSDLNTLVRMGSTKVGMQITVAAGDFNHDGIDEIADTYWGPSGGADDVQWVEVHSVDTSTSTWSLVHHSWTNVNSKGYAVNIAVGDVNQDAVAEIVLAWESGKIHNFNTLRVLQVSSDLKSITAKGSYTESSLRKNSNTPPAIALGGFDGKSLRVGPPVHTLLSKVQSTVAIISQPPKHRDTIGKTSYDINPDTCEAKPCTYVRYEKQDKNSTKMSTSTKRTWDVSATFSYKLAPIFKYSITASYGHEFEHGTTSFTSTTFGQNLLADADDAIVYSVQDLDVWEYPIYNDSSDHVQDYMVIIFPRPESDTCQPNCTGGKLLTQYGISPSSPYAPNHEPYNVLSYSMQPPGNISKTIKSGIWNELGPNPWEMLVSWSDIKDDDTKKSWHAGIGVEGEIGEKLAPGHLTLKGSYNRSDLSTTQTSFEEETAIHIVTYKIQPEYSYRIEPYIYWSKHGTLIVDYVVSPTANWWKTTYNKPDPAFNLPWKNNPKVNDPLQTREISFDPPSPKVGQPITITTKIRNYSPQTAQNVPVTIYNGDPDKGGSQKIDSFKIDTLNSQGIFVHTTRWTPPAKQATLNIYGKIESYPNQMHVENDKAYAALPVVSGESPVAPTSLSIAADEIVSPAPVMLETPTYISATVRATGDTFTRVALEFWEGEPHQDGSKVIGGRVIPLVARDEAVTDGIWWTPTGATGPHTIWVVIRGAEAEDIYSDNQASQTIHVEPKPSSTAKIHLSPANLTVAISHTAASTVQVEDVTNLYGVDFRLTYNPTIVAVQDADPVEPGIQINPGGLFEGKEYFVARNWVDPAAGTIEFIASLRDPAAPIDGSGALAAITWRGVTTGASTLTFDQVKLSDHDGQPIEPQVENGAIQVTSSTGGDLSGRVQLQGRADHSGVNVYLMTNKADCLAESAAAAAPIPGVPSAVTDAAGYFSLTPVPGRAYGCLKVIHNGYLAGQQLDPALTGDLETITLPGGEVTGDNAIDIFDLSYVASRYGSADPTADINTSGLVDIFDLVIVAGNYGKRGPITWP